MLLVIANGHEKDKMAIRDISKVTSLLTGRGFLSLVEPRR